MPVITIREYFVGKSVFITGGTGFMGKVLVEKFLRDCSGIKNIYLLVRSKKGQTSEERLKAFTNSRAFEKLLQQDPNALNKLRLVSGDITKDNLGLSNRDEEELQRNCQIVVNNAACIRFNINLREAVNTNTLGSLKVIKFCEKIKKLEVFLHVSTTYCHDDIEVVEDKLYPSKHDPQDIINMLKWMDDKTLSAVQSELIRPFPNTYAYSKCLTEQLLSQYRGKFPIVIARPTIVLASHKQPMPGWIDNINGPTGAIYAAYRGFLHTIYYNNMIPTETIPVDLVINAIIILAYLAALEKPKEIRVCNISLYGMKTEYWVESALCTLKYMREYPLSYSMWYLAANPKTNKWENKIDAFFLHTLPAYFIDFALYVIGKEPFMVKLLERMNFSLNSFEYYFTRQWTFKNDYYRSLKNKISKEDNEIFETDVSVYSTEEFLKNYVLGLREFYCKEDLSTLPQARKLLTRLYCLHVATKYTVYTILFYLFYLFTKKIMSLYNLYM